MLDPSFRRVNERLWVFPSLSPFSFIVRFDPEYFGIGGENKSLFSFPIPNRD